MGTFAWYSFINVLITSKRLSINFHLEKVNNAFSNISVDKIYPFFVGVSMRSKEAFNKNQVQILPFTLLPSSFPRKNFEKAKNIQVLLNELIHKGSSR